MKFYSIRFTIKSYMNQIQKAIYPMYKGTTASHCTFHNLNIPFHEQTFTKKLLKTIIYYKKDSFKEFNCYIQNNKPLTIKLYLLIIERFNHQI